MVRGPDHSASAAYRQPWQDIEKPLPGVSHEQVIEALREVAKGLLDCGRPSWAISVGQAVAYIEAMQARPGVFAARDLYLEVADRLWPHLREALAVALNEEGL